MAPRWTFRLAKERRVQARRPVVWDDQLLLALHYDKAGFFQSRLLALDLRTGEERWSHGVDHVGNEPVVQAGCCFWTAFDGSVSALDAAGQLRWRTQVSDCNLGLPVLAGERLLVGEIGGGSRFVHCLDTHSGRSLWRCELGGHVYPMAVAGEQLLISVAASPRDGGPTCGVLHALALDSGRLHWSASDPRAFHLFNPLPLGDRVGVTSNRSLQVRDLRSGKQLIELDLEAERSSLRLLPQSDGDCLFVWRDSHAQGQDSLSALELSSSRGLFGRKHALALRWRKTEPRGLCEPPLRLDDGRLLYLTQDGCIVSVDAATGATRSEFALKTKAGSSGGLALGQGLLFVGQGAQAFALPLDTSLSSAVPGTS